MFARSIAYIRQKAKRRPSVKYISSISTLRSALIAGACEPVCPVEAIFENDALPEKWKHYAQINADYYKKSE
jgi:formate hydrogenlyase subunit 6/NADH:ubiquinone oxidoreductase subunit I